MSNRDQLQLQHQHQQTSFHRIPWSIQDQSIQVRSIQAQSIQVQNIPCIRVHMSNRDQLQLQHQQTSFHSIPWSIQDLSIQVLSIQVQNIPVQSILGWSIQVQSIQDPVQSIHHRSSRDQPWPRLQALRPHRPQGRELRASSS